MLVREITENYKQVYARNHKGGVTRKYRCTSGQKKGRVVAKAATCSSPIKSTRSHTLKRTRTTVGKRQSIKRSQTTKRPTYGRVTKLNKKSIKPKRKR